MDNPKDYEIVHNGGMTYSVVLYKGEKVCADKWDGHTPDVAAQRLEDYLLGKY